jgi:hypothetical protein
MSKKKGSRSIQHGSAGSNHIRRHATASNRDQHPGNSCTTARRPTMRTQICLVSPACRSSRCMTGPRMRLTQSAPPR